MVRIISLFFVFEKGFSCVEFRNFVSKYNLWDFYYYFGESVCYKLCELNKSKCFANLNLAKIFTGKLTKQTESSNQVTCCFITGSCILKCIVASYIKRWRTSFFFVFLKKQNSDTFPSVCSLIDWLHVLQCALFLIRCLWLAEAFNL